MERVGLISYQVSNINCSNPTGHTVNYGDVSIDYIHVKNFCKKFNVSERQLKRYRDDIVYDKLGHEHRFYFHDTNGTFFYNEKIIADYRKNKHPKPKNNSQFIDASTQPFTVDLYDRLKDHSWDFRCGINYKRKLEIYECVEMIKKVNEDLLVKFPNAFITLFYTTEKNEGKRGYHNHLALSIKNIKTPSENQIRNVFCEAGTSVPWADAYDQQENWIKYICKEIHLHPDGWGIYTNSQSDSKALFQGLTNEPLYTPKSY